MAGVNGLYKRANVENLKDVIIKFTAQIDGFAAHKIAQKAKLNLAENTFKQLLNRTRLNLEGIASMLDIYKVQSVMIHPISHIIRCVLVDFLNFCYLITFYDKKEKNLESFSNELDHFDTFLAMDDLSQRYYQTRSVSCVISQSPHYLSDISKHVRQKKSKRKTLIYLEKKATAYIKRFTATPFPVVWYYKFLKDA